MKRILGVFALTALLASASAHAQAQQAAGFYGTASAGWFQLQDRDGSVAGSSVKAEYDPGYALTLGGGYAYGNGFRTEIEAGYAQANSDKMKVGATTGNGGDAEFWSLYAAAYYDFNVGGSFKPYLGGGLGWVHSHTDSATVGGTRVAGGSSDDWSAFAEGGLNFALASNLDLVPGVRYTWYNDAKNGLEDNGSWLFKVGLRYKF
ncbi:MAG: outer membrane protein [Gemmatimonas sp.]